RKAKSLVAEGLQALAKLRVVPDGRALRDLDDDALRSLDLVLVEGRIGEVEGIDIQKKKLVGLKSRRHAFDGATAAKTAQLPDQVRFRGDVEHHLRTAQRTADAARQRFI